MWQLKNHTDFAVARALLKDQCARHIWVVAVKATYDLYHDGRVQLAAHQEPVTQVPIYRGAAGESSLTRAGELVLAHPGTDVTLNATAHAPHGEPVTEMTAAIAVGPLQHQLRIVGNRTCHESDQGPIISAPQPFTQMPITYERAYGGTLIDNGSVSQVAHNPVGRGFCAAPADLIGQTLPNIEDPAAPFQLGQAAKPTGFGAIAVSWSPRRDRTGTFDDDWRRNQAPLWPTDFDPRCFITAPAALHLARYLRGGEAVTLTGLAERSPWRFQLPRPHLVIETQRDGRLWREKTRLERVILEPDRAKLMMVWASRLDCGSRGKQVVFSRISTKKKRRLKPAAVLAGGAS